MHHSEVNTNIEVKIMTTIRADESTVNRLHGIKGWLKYTQPKKNWTLEDALIYLIDEFDKKHPK